MLDGRQGLRPTGDKKGTRTTSLPCALALSCTWHQAAARAFGRVLAEEMLALNQHVLLAAMLNLVRSPLGGRNFEDFGEDPVLGQEHHRMGAGRRRAIEAAPRRAVRPLPIAHPIPQRWPAPRDLPMR
jgi:hypothetical protein